MTLQCTQWISVVILVTTSLLCVSHAIDDIPSQYISSKPVKSLFCNACSVLASIVNDTLYDESTDFESLVGFRLDSTGKKIRKQSDFLKLFLSLEDVCDDWKDKYRVGKRKNDYLYLIESDVVKAMEDIERKRKQKLEREASERLNAKWDQEWEVEKLEAETKWNATHDADGNLIANETDDEESSTAAQDEEGQNEQDKDSESDASDGDDESDEDDEGVSEEAEVKRYFYEKKPKLLKRNHKTHKMVKDICFFLNEKYDEWLHEQQSVISRVMQDGDSLTEYLKPYQFCLEDKKLCKEAMFERKPKIFKFKKQLNLPKKPERVWEPPKPTSQQMQEGADYEEQMEDDDDVEGKPDNDENDEAKEQDTKSEL
eukprot:CAMPEP_0197038346 /NCGR_PEP_ID=MMETSP1384-20130603/15298_1 /TAXON_ID=29189 /ORGANISM="Ammonia sp." /LENGTH=370 /DNA_ID=CAMNT_0042468763 /DNA_START=28 /DNA_END=1140 /DNA_ORIENTATION=-